MSDAGLITASHRARAAVIYVRQSTLAQVERNRSLFNRLCERGPNIPVWRMLRWRRGHSE